ncbi:hypothetical protein EDB81DRAFT_782316 [Dactylonectria macrodidyma]|uniref:Kelch repeat protein n=1 Tax=Dactylonectria macrodidyma TaxID=307937 RepID=A0A9P9FLZ7_9HYPO|nr:hypothetical protein EDB81DRAFT_782316 [Dactylonectria macrodidyma]
MRSVELTAAVLALVSVALGQTGSPKKLESRATESAFLYRRRALHAIAVLNDRLYIEGGETSPYNETDNTLLNEPTAPLNKTLWLPLDTSWTNSTVNFTEIEQDEPLPVNNLRLWADADSSTIYRWGGDGPAGTTDVAEDIALWSMKVDSAGSGTWAQKTAANDGFFADLYSAASGGGTVCDGLGIYLGGYGSSATDTRLSDTAFPDRMPVPGLLTYNMTGRTWANESTVPLNSPDGTWTSGETLCVPGFGDNSLVFVIGGTTTPVTTAARADSHFSDFSNITFYDPVAQKWHWQEAGGDVPRGRAQLCAVGVKGENTYDIYVYGGVDSSDNALSDISVLSIPGFQWFSLDVTSSARMRQTCALVGKSQMLVLGGIEVEWVWDTPDPWEQALGVFDLKSWQWSDKYDAEADAYDSPDTVLNWYKEGGYGAIDWSSDAVESLFGTATIWPTSNSSSTSSASASASASSSSSDSSTPVGAIAGGVVGGVAVLALIGAAFFFWRRKQRTRKPDPQELEPISPSQELHSQSVSPAVKMEQVTPVKPVELPGTFKAAELPG